MRTKGSGVNFWGLGEKQKKDKAWERDEFMFKEMK